MNRLHETCRLRFRSFIRTLAALVFLVTALRQSTPAVEIPLDAMTPSRIGYIDLQKVFDIFPEKSYAEGDLLREIEKRKNALSNRQAAITALRQQIAVDQNALDQAKAGHPVRVPANAMANIVEEQAPTLPTRAAPVKVSSSTAVEPYPTDEPLQGLPGHDQPIPGIPAATPPISPTHLPGMEESQTTSPSPFATSTPMLDLMASATGPVLLNPEVVTALQKRVDDNRHALDRAILEFRDFRSKAIEDMKQLQTQKTYDVMSKIYAVLQNLAQDESVTIVLDKTYVLYGEDTVDLTDKLIARLREGGAPGSETP